MDACQWEVVVISPFSNYMAKLSLGIFLLLLVPVRDLRAQDKREYGSVPREKVFQSRAEFEAEQRVSLSAEQIIPET